MFGKRILVLVPHPDDEVVACAAAIGRAQVQGAQIFALYLTHGCIARESLWPWQRKNHENYVARRRVEGEKTAEMLGITPVGWSQRPARHLAKNLAAAAYDIRAAIGSCAIDQLWVPAYEGGNADHDALNGLAQIFRDQFGVLEFAEYNFFEGRARAQEFPQPNGTEIVITLTEAEKKKKRELLALYESERGNLGYVRSERECFRPLATYDYSRPPHPGTLWYARFQWVPFHHPRVDFTRPREISAALGAFLESFQEDRVRAKA